MSSSPTSAQKSLGHHAIPLANCEPQLETPGLTIKRKRRVDARQLDVLNAAYARTAFPSTEERAELAKQLDLSARSIQLWSAHSLVYTVIHDF